MNGVSRNSKYLEDRLLLTQKTTRGFSSISNCDLSVGKPYMEH